MRQLHEHGNYTLNLTSAKTSNIIIPISGDKPNFTPIWGTFLALVGAQLIYSGLEYYLKKSNSPENNIENPNFAENDGKTTDAKIATPVATKKRLHGLFFEA